MTVEPLPLSDSCRDDHGSIGLVRESVPRPFKPTVVAEMSRVVSNDAVNAEYYHLVVECGPVATAAEPGQFFSLLCPKLPGEEPFLRRPMSLYGTNPHQGRIEFLYKVVGSGTRGLATLKRGDLLDIMGPLGRGFALDPGLTDIVAVGRGAGLATLAPLAKAARRNGTRVTAVFSARRPDLMVSVGLFEEQGATVIQVTDQEATSGPANVERILRELITDGRCQAFFTCGSSRLMRVQQRLAEEFSLPGQVAIEQQMACGIGLCFCCVRDFNVGGTIVNRRVCWDGPVFDLLETLP